MPIKKSKKKPSKTSKKASKEPAIEAGKTKKKKEFVLNVAIFAALRRLFRRWPAYIEITKEKRTVKEIQTRKGKLLQRVFFRCNICGEVKARKECVVDHIAPVIDPKTGFIDWNTYVQRLFCAKDNLQVICKPCHKVKSNKENAERRNIKKKKERK